MNTTADKAITGAIATVKNNSSKIKSVKIKVKFADKSDGLKKYATKKKLGAKGMAWKGPA